MEMRSTFHLKFHMHYFKATLFQYGQNKNILMGLMMLFRKREIKTTKRCGTCGHINRNPLLFHKQKKICFSWFYFIICYQKEKSWFPKLQLAKKGKHLLKSGVTKCCSDDAHSSAAPFPPVGFSGSQHQLQLRTGETEEYISGHYHVWALISK